MIKDVNIIANLRRYSLISQPFLEKSCRLHVEELATVKGLFVM
ncbi:hypothetical protein SAMN05421754_10361, partial [Nitrosomonas sp. Nm58]